jgi:peptidoglycan/LPS O-acetylase OafA/YrhL
MTDGQPDSSTEAPRGPSHLPALDGIRGLAILMVLAAHVFGMPGGVFGVDLFFVLSGFLITRLLLADRTRPDGYFRRFYIRRLVRIAPPYLVMLAIILTTSASVRPYWWVFVFYLSDFPLRPSPALGHTWSLAIEEQFYLVWPLVVRRTAPANILRICAACLVVAAGVRLMIPHLVASVEDARYYFSFAPFSRTDGLFVGAGVAVLASIAPAWLDRWSSAVMIFGCGVIAGLAVTHQFSLSMMSPLMAVFGFPAIALVFGALVWKGSCAGKKGLFGRVFTLPALRRLGRVSYTVYLAHVPMLVLFETHKVAQTLGRIGSRLTAVLLAYVIAEASWRVLERPMMKLKERWT